MSDRLKTALANLKDLVDDVRNVVHGFTDAHVNETRRRAVRIGAGLIGEDHTKYVAVMEVGMQVVADVQARNTEALNSNNAVAVAGIASDKPVWQDRLESLEYSLNAYGLQAQASCDDGFVVLPQAASASASTYEALRARLPDTMDLSSMEVVTSRRVSAAVADTYLGTLIASGSKLDKDDMILLASLLDENAMLEEKSKLFGV